MKNLTTKRQDFFTARFIERYNSPTDYSYALKKRITEVMEKPESFNPALFEEFHLNEIHNYIFHSHSYYKEFWIPKIENTLAQFSTRAKDSLANFRTKRQRAFQIICVFFEKYKTELLDHIALEEQILIPIAENQIKGIINPQISHTMLIQFLNTHSDNIILDLDKIYNEIETYEPSLKKDLGYNVFKTQLNILQNDLIIHSKIEDEIYVEKVLKNISQHNHIAKVNNA